VPVWLSLLVIALAVALVVVLLTAGHTTPLWYALLGAMIAVQAGGVLLTLSKRRAKR
jgi:hypothetical protein